MDRYKKRYGGNLGTATFFAHPNKPLKGKSDTLNCRALYSTTQRNQNQQQSFFIFFNSVSFSIHVVARLIHAFLCWSPTGLLSIGAGAVTNSTFRIRVNQGVLDGFIDSTFKTFVAKGVPFAAPPVGVQRLGQESAKRARSVQAA